MLGSIYPSVERKQSDVLWRGACTPAASLAAWEHGREKKGRATGVGPHASCLHSTVGGVSTRSKSSRCSQRSRRADALLEGWQEKFRLPQTAEDVSEWVVARHVAGPAGPREAQLW